MRKYETPEIKISNFASCDVITSSSGDYEALNSLPMFYEKPQDE